MNPMKWMQRTESESDEMDAMYVARIGKYVTCVIVNRDHMGTCTP